MSIRPDTWIEKMAREHALISPFEPAQIRAVDGKPVVSYGLSSFGYDVRVADEFRVFTNVYCNIVDPKAFDARGLAEFKGPHCDIPPNSFALGITLEKFRIPRNVLTLCVGKPKPPPGPVGAVIVNCPGAAAPPMGVSALLVTRPLASMNPPLVATPSGP